MGEFDETNDTLGMGNKTTDDEFVIILEQVAPAIWDNMIVGDVVGDGTVMVANPVTPIETFAGVPLLTEYVTVVFGVPSTEKIASSPKHIGELDVKEVIDGKVKTVTNWFWVKFSIQFTIWIVFNWIVWLEVGAVMVIVVAPLPSKFMVWSEPPFIA